jgi:hypothetical protein
MAYLTCRVKALDTTVISHGDDLQLIASASSDGEIKTWIMASDGNVTQNGSYDTGNRLLCLTVHDGAIEQLDEFPHRGKPDAESDDTSSSNEELNEEEEWQGIE